jgi:hypothetical protein
MSRFPSHAIDDAPEGSRPILQKIAESSPTKRPLNVHAQMAHAPAVLAAYTALRAVHCCQFGKRHGCCLEGR